MRWESRANKKQFDVYQKRTNKFPWVFSISDIASEDKPQPRQPQPRQPQPRQPHPQPFQNGIPLGQINAIYGGFGIGRSVFFDYYERYHIPKRVKDWLEEMNIPYIQKGPDIKLKKKDDLMLLKLTWG